MTPKGLQIYLNHRRVLLLHGPRRCGKSYIAYAMLLQHAFLNDGAICAIIVNGLSASVGSGAWEKLTNDRGMLETVWFKAGIGCEWAVPATTASKKVGPTMKGDTKMRWCRIRNIHGGYSEIQIHTLQKADYVDKFKDSNFTFLYLVEADKWDDLQVLNKLRMQLRSDYVPHPKRCVVLDCNPPPNGTHHWLYTYFIKNSAGQYPPDLDPDIQEVGFVIDDNTFISQAEKDEVRKTHEYDPTELARNYYGKWISSSKGTVFEHQFSREKHIIGDISSFKESEHQLLLPPPGAYDFPSGWDMGDARNHAAVIACKVLLKGKPCIYIIDEVVHLNVNYSAANFSGDFMERVHYWNELMKKRQSPNLWWKFWSDSSSLRYAAAADRSVATAIYEASDGFIQLDGVKKGAGNITQRIICLQRALYEDQIFVSARCVHVAEMLEKLRRRVNGELDKDDRLKHIFDALTYMLTYELPQFEVRHDPEPEGVISF